MKHSKTQILFLFCLLLTLPLSLHAQDAGDGNGGDNGGGDAGGNVNGGHEGGAALVVGSGGSNSASAIQTDEFSGATTYSVTIPVPPGRGGLEPSLSLNYHSFRKNPNSWVGYGWELDMGSIVRTSDGGSIDFERGETFDARFGGQAESLVFVEKVQNPADYGINVAAGEHVDRYQAKVEGAFNIYLHLINPDQHPDFQDLGWVVIDKSGKRYNFGPSLLGRDQAGIEDNNGQRILNVGRWLLESITDPNGNELHVRYGHDHLLEEITYNDITVLFTKSARDTYYPIFRESFLSPESLGQQLTSIEVQSHGQRLQKIVLGYEQSTLNGTHTLSSVTQYGQDDSQSLPPTQFFYNKPAPAAVQPLSWGGPGFNRTASRQFSLNDPPKLITKGFLNDYVEFADMNGDGLVDQVVGFKYRERFKVYFNDGNDFVEGPNGTSDWPDTFKCPLQAQDPDGFDECINRLGKLKAFQGDAQEVYLIDMNGDKRADRVRRGKNAAGHPAFEIAFNNGSKFLEPVFWDDPVEPNGDSNNARLTGNRGLIDMNGDGLVDRVQGVRDRHQYYFNVYFNTGKEFQHFDREEDIPHWTDPIAVNPDQDGDPAGGGRLYKQDSGGTYVTIRDFNGDGLPDRIEKADFTDNTAADPEHQHIGGFLVYLNRNGTGWAQPGRCADRINCQLVNDYDVLAIRDPVQDKGARGYINGRHDLIDMNGDGYLDRVEGTQDEQRRSIFKVYLFKGTAGHEHDIPAFGDPITFFDPAWDIHDNRDRKGFLQNTDKNRNTYIFTMDFDGDSFPDRVAVSEDSRPGHAGEMQYTYYPLHLGSGLIFSSVPRRLLHVAIHQPFGLLSKVDSGYGNRVEVEYLPSTLPMDAQDPLAHPNHRYMPFNLWVAHKIYNYDYTMPLTPGSPEEIRHPYSRVVTYDYSGGNIFMRLPTEPTANDGELPKIHNDRNYIFRFNGFSQVKKTTEKAHNESWGSYTVTSTYYQAAGDVLISPAIQANFPNATYSHITLSGRAASQEIRAEEPNGAITRVVETSTWNIEHVAHNEFLCDDDFKYCLPHLTRQTKQVFEPQGPPRVSSIGYEYDELNNITREMVYQGDAIFLDKHTVYAAPNIFNPTFQIRDHPESQSQQDGAGNILRAKQFGYDARGNPSREIFEGGLGAQNPTITRRFDATGNLTSIIDIDGLTKTFDYDADGLFPIHENLVVGGGQILTTTRAYDRYTGQPKEETNPYGVRARKVFDDFGRVTDEFVQDTAGTEIQTKKVAYEYIPDQTIEGVDHNMLFKTTVWQPQDGHPETDIGQSPAVVSWADGSGAGLQKCSYTEKGNYRVIQTRVSDGGREEKINEPVFSDNCNFLPAFANNDRATTSIKDFQGRILSITPPLAQDAGSPVSRVRFDYSTDNQAHLVKVSHFPLNQTKTEVYDFNDRLVSVTDASGSTINYFFNVVGDLETVTSAGQPQPLTEIQYDALGRKTAMNDVDMGTWTYAYDRFGRLQNQTDAKGQRIEYTYTTLNRVLRKTVRNAQGNVERVEQSFYDAGDGTHSVQLGELFKVEERDGQNHVLRSSLFGYEPLFRRGSIVTREVPGLATFDQTMEYSQRGQLTRARYPGGKNLFYQYGKTGGMEKLCSAPSCDFDKHEVYYQVDPDAGYDVFGALLSEKFGNGVTTAYDYYSNSHRLHGKTTGKDGTVYSQRQYTFDATSNIASIGDPLISLGTGALNQVRYDNLNRLISYTQVGGDPAKTLTYDFKGNILTNSSSYGNTPYEYTSPKLHAVTRIGDEQFTYDDNGNMTADGARRMTYNGENQMVRVNMQNGVVVDYEYDYTGARVEKHTVRTDPAGHVHEATTHYLGQAMEIRGDRLIFNVSAGDRRIATMDVGSLHDLGIGAGTLRNNNISLPWSPVTLVPFALMLFPLWVIASLRPVRRSWVVDRRSWIARYKLGHFTIHDLRSTIHELRSAICAKWSFYVQCCRQLLLNFNRGWLPRTLVLFSILEAFLMPFPAQAGVGATAPASDQNYFYFIHDDQLGSAHVLTEGNESSTHAGIVYNRGDILQRFEYDPFGTEKFVLNPNLRFDPRYTGQEYDLETGLYYYKSRYYNPKLARFIQPDTIVPSAKNLQAYNRYSYVTNNPLKFTDPSGHMPGWVKIVAAFIATVIAVAVTIITLGAAFNATLATATLWQAVLAGSIGGAIGGAVGGAITGGAQGALFGAIFGLVTGAIGGAIGNGIGQIANVALRNATIGVLATVGASLAYATGGWEGLACFGASALGALAGGAIGKALISKSQTQLTMPKRGFHFEYEKESGVSLADATSDPSYAGNATDVSVYFWEGAGSGGSSFGHVSVSIGDTTYSFNPHGWKIEPDSQYFARNLFRGADVIRLNLNETQAMQLKTFLLESTKDYNLMSWNCGDPIENWAESQGYDMGLNLTPKQLENSLMKTTNLIIEKYRWPSFLLPTP